MTTPSRGVTVISDRGIDALKSNPPIIDVRFLSQYPEFLEFKSQKSEKGSTNEPISMIDTLTPEENIENAYTQLRQALAQDLVEQVLLQTPQFFEQLVVELLVKMGYGGSEKEAGEAIGQSGDEVIDGIIKEDRLGLDVIYIQAKRWQAGNTVGRPQIQQFVGALAGQGAKKGVFITTSTFTKDAKSYTPKNETKIVLIDGEQLAQLMIDNNIGVSPTFNYELKKIDSDYFND